MKHSISLIINGDPVDAIVKDNLTLLDFLRDQLFLTGTKKGCEEGECGACTVMLDGKPVNSCCTLAVECDGHDIITVEGIAENGMLHPIQKQFIEKWAMQCGYCTPGIIRAAKALLLENPHPTGDEIKEAMSGNYCRCISHYTVLRAINRVAGNEEDHLAVMHRANDDVENPIPVRQELFLSPYANGTNSDHSLD